MSGRGGTEQAPGRLPPGPGCDSAPSPDADRNVLSHPSVLLVVLLNVALSSLPRLAVPVIRQALRKPHSKVRVAEVPPAHSWHPPTRAGAGSRDAEGIGAGGRGLETQMHTQRPQEGRQQAPELRKETILPRTEAASLGPAGTRSDFTGSYLGLGVEMTEVTWNGFRQKGELRNTASVHRWMNGQTQCRSSTQQDTIQPFQPRKLWPRYSGDDPRGRCAQRDKPVVTKGQLLRDSTHRRSLEG